MIIAELFYLLAKKTRQQMAVGQTAGRKTPIVACRLYWAAVSSPGRLNVGLDRNRHFLGLGFHTQ